MLQEQRAPIVDDTHGVTGSPRGRLADLPRGLRIHLAVYALVNALLVLTWVVIEIAGVQGDVRVSVVGSPLPEDFPWPVFSIVIWGAFVLASVRKAQRAAPHTRTLPTALPTKTTAVPPTRAAGAHELTPRGALAAHAAVYLAVNAVIVAGWAVSGGFFWPIIPLAGWGVGLAMHAYRVRETEA